MKAKAIHYGDQYSIPVRIKDSAGRAITRDIVSDVTIKIGNIAKRLSKNEIQFDDENNLWMFPITSEETKVLYKNSRTFEDAVVPMQIKVRIGNDVIQNDVANIEIKKSILNLLE